MIILYLPCLMMITAHTSAAKAVLSAAGFRAGNLINKKNIEIGGQVLPLKRTNLIPVTLQEKEREKERDRERERERERENQKVFPSLRDPETSPRLMAGGGAEGKAGEGIGMRTESCTSLRKGRYYSAHHLLFLSTFILTSPSHPLLIPLLMKVLPLISNTMSVCLAPFPFILVPTS